MMARRGRREQGTGLAIVLDTNAFYGDVYATGRLLAAVFDGAAAGDYRVVVPEVVVLELVRQFPERLAAAVRYADKAMNQIAKDARQLGLPTPNAVTLDTEALAAAYEPAIRHRLSAPGSRIASNPARLSDAIAWAVGRRHPFKPTGEGLPDAAIWLTVLEVASGADRVLFVSENSTDFADPLDDTQLAPALIADLRAAGFAPNHVELVKSLSDLVERILQPLAAADVRALRMLGDADVADRIRAAVVNQLLYFTVPQAELELPADLDEDPQIVAIDLDEPTLLTARELPERRLLLALTFAADATLDFQVAKEDLDQFENEPGVAIEDPDLNERYARCSAEAELRVTVRVVTDLAGTDVTPEALEYAGQLTDFDRASRRLNPYLTEQLIEAVGTAAVGVRVRGYMPPYTVEGDIETATAVRVGAQTADLETVEEFDGVDVRCVFALSGEAQIEWLVTAPTPSDLANYGHLAEGDASGGGWLGATEDAEPVLVSVEALVGPGGELLEFNLLSIQLERGELTRRDEDARGDSAAEDGLATESTDGNSWEMH